jgi:phosphopantothenate synthetase
MSRSESAPADAPHGLAESIRRALIEAGEAAYEDAGIQGLCAEGRWEAAVAAMRTVDVAEVARRAAAADDPHPSVTRGE